MHQFAIAYGERFTRPAAQYAARLLLNRWTLHGASNTEIQTAPLPGCANTVIGDLMIKVSRQAHEERLCRAIQQDLRHLSPRLLRLRVTTGSR